MVDVTTTIIIERPVDAVATYSAEPDNATGWYKNIKSVVWKTDRPLKTGSEIQFSAQFLGRTLTYVYRIEEFIPKQKLVMKTSEGPFPMETTYAWRPTEDGHTEMTLRNRGYPRGFSKLVAPLMKSAMRKANMKDLKRLKKVMESN